MEYFKGDNPAAWKGNLEPILGKPKHEKKLLASLPYSEIPKFVKHLRTKDAISAKALELLKSLEMNKSLSDLIFLSPQGKKLSDMAITALLRRMHSE